MVFIFTTNFYFKYVNIYNNFDKLIFFNSPYIIGTIYLYKLGVYVMKLRRGFWVLLLIVLLTGCNSDSVGKKENTSKKTDNKPVISIIADSEQSLALFKKEEKNIEKKFGVHLEYHYPDRLNDNLEDFLFASKQTYDIYMLFPAKISQYVERDLLLPFYNILKTQKI